MWWLLYAVIFSASIYRSECQNDSVTEEEFTSMLHDAVVDVFSQHSEAASKSKSPPYFKMPENFMRSFVPETGVGNREELVIDKVFPLPVFEDITFSRFLFKHFNNTDYVAGISNNYMALLKINKSLDGYLTLSAEQTVLSSHVESGMIKDVVLFPRIVDYSQVFSVAVLTENVKTSVVYIYEVLGDIGMVVATIDLNIHPSSGSVKKIGYVQSSHGGSLVVLTSTGEKSGIVYNQRGHSKLNYYIEVNYPSAVDLLTFTIQGHGYIAVANVQFCEIFKMDEFSGSHIFFDRLGPFTGISDLEYFRLGFHHFLAVADSDSQNLYTWKKGEFAPKQKVVIPNVSQIFASTVESCRDEVILLAVMENGNVVLQVFSGETEEFTKFDSAIPEGYLVKPGSLTSFTDQETVVVLFSSLFDQPEAFVIKTSLKSLKDPLLVQGEQVSKLMKEIQSMIDSQKKEIKRIKAMLKNAVRGSGTQHISNIQYFEDISATNGTVVEEVNEFVLGWEDSSLTLQEYRQGTADLRNNVESLEKLVTEIEQKIPDVVRTDENTVITGQKIFTGYVSAKNLMATSLNLHTVAGVDLPQLQKDVYRLDKPQVIEGTLTFKEPMKVTGNFDVETTVNGIDIGEEVMTRNTEQNSNAQMVFVNTFTVKGDLDVSEKVNGVDVNKEVVTLHGHHHISAEKNFSNGIQAENVKTKFLDGIDIDDLYRKAFTVSGDQTVTGDAAFSTVTTNDITLGGNLNGYDVKELEKNIVRIDRPATITGFKTFTNDVKIDGELSVLGTVNGLRIPDDLVITDKNQNITGTKEFVGKVTAHAVNVLGKVDDIKIPEDIVTLSKDEEISSTLYFTDGISAEKDIIVEGLVDGVDISEIAKQAMKLNETNEFEKAAFLGPVTITGDLNVSGLVNEIDLKKVLGDIVFKDEKPLEILSTKTFKKVTADKVELDRFINGFNINVDFMKVHGDQVINGTKTFKAAEFNSIAIDDGMIDGMNVEELYQQRITLSFEDNAEDHETEFVDNVIVEDLTVHGSIDGIKIPQDVVLKNSNQAISNKHFTNRVVVDNLLIDGDIDVENFAGINLPQFYKDRITLSGNQEIPGDIWLENASAAKLSISGLVNGMNISDFASNVMSKTKPHQVVTASKEFSGNVSVFGNIHTQEGVNGFKLADIKQKAFKLLEDNVITSPLEFDENITLNHLVVKGDINGVNVTRLNEDSLKKSGLQHIKGDTVFQAGFDVVGDIVANKVNGLVLTKDVLLKSVPQTIGGQFTFGSLNIDGDLEVKGLINGLNLAEVAPKLARIDGSETTIESDIVFSSFVRVHEDIDVTGMVNEVDLKAIVDRLLTKTGDQDITGHKVFRGNVTIIGDIDAKFVNGIEWKKFLDDVVWIHVPQVIHTPKTFAKDVYIQDDLFVSGLAQVRLINGKDLQKFVDDAVFIDQPANITGPIIFKNPVEITGDLNADLINGLRLKTDVITIMCSDDGPQTITGQKTFQNLKVYGDIYTEAVNSYDLQELYEDTLLTEGNQTVTGRKVIYGDVVFKKDVYPDTVNGMILNRDLVTLHTEQKIEGPMLFQDDVFVEKDMLINGLLNGVDLQNLSRDAVYLKTDQVIDGAYSIEQAVTHSNVEVSGTVNDIDLPVFDRNVSEFLSETKSSVEIMDSYLEEQCQLAKYLQEILGSSYYALDNFAFHQELEVPASFIQVKNERNVSLVYVDDFATAATTVEHVWDNSTKTFLPSNFLADTSIARSFSFRVASVAFAINIGINSIDSSVLVETAQMPDNVQSGFSDASVSLGKTQAVIVLLFPDRNTCEVYLLKEHPQKTYSFEHDSTLRVAKGSTSVVIFKISTEIYLATSSSQSYGSQIYTKRTGNWQVIQRTQASGPFVKHFEYHNYHYLAFGNDAPVYETKEPKSIQIYRNSGPYDSIFVLFQKVPFDNARGMELFQYGDLLQLHMVTWNETRIQVFALEGESGMNELITLHGNCVRDVKPLLIGDDLYLIVGQQNLKTEEAVKSLLYKGMTKGSKYKAHSMEYC